MKLSAVQEEALTRLTDGRRYSKSVKETVIRRVLGNEESYESLRREYQIAGSTTIQKWLMQIGLYSPHNTVVTNGSYSITFKRQVAYEVQSGALTMEEARRKHQIKGSSTVSRWCKKYNMIQFTPVSNRKVMKDQVEQEKALKQRIKELEKQLQESELKREVLDTMINMAERTMKIDIRKKSYTHQSPK
jgi:transposase